jgi:hypothetical protein
MVSDIDPNLRIAIASQDSDLQALFELEILGSTSSVSETRADIIELYSDEEVLQLRQDIMRQYDLSENDMRRAIGRCVALVTRGVNIGFVPQIEK